MAQVVAVSPIVDGDAVRGPAAQMMRSLGVGPGSGGVADYYARTWPGLIDRLVIDGSDASEAAAVAASGAQPHVTRTLIADHAERRRLAEEILELAGTP